MQYQDIYPISREDAMQAFSTDDEEKICYSMVSVAFYEQDWKWAQDKCLDFLEDKNIRFSSLAATCLGHIARVHGKLTHAPCRYSITFFFPSNRYYGCGSPEGDRGITRLAFSVNCAESAVVSLCSSAAMNAFTMSKLLSCDSLFILFF